jgi:hypothetical protein
MARLGDGSSSADHSTNEGTDYATTMTVYYKETRLD